MPKTQSNSSETALDNADDLRAIKAIFEPTAILIDDPERQRNIDEFNRRNVIIEFIADAYIEMLGNSAEFDIGFCDPEPIGDDLFRRDVIVTCKCKFKLFFDRELMDKVWRALVEINLPSSDKSWILSGVIERVKNSCTLTYRFVNDQLHILTDGVLPFEITENDVVYPPVEKQPMVVALALANLRSLERELVFHSLEKELESLSLPDQLIEVKSRIPAAAFRPGYRQVLEKMEAELTRKLELEQQRKLLHESIERKDIMKADPKGTSDESGCSEGKALIGKPKLTVDQFIMLMFAIGGSRIKGLDRSKVAIGLSALTGNATNQFIKRFSQILMSEKNGISKFSNQTDAYNKDVEKVCEILTKMGLTDEVNKLRESSYT